MVADVQYSEVGAPLSLSKEQLGIGKTDRDVQVQCKEAIRLSLLYQQKLVLQWNLSVKYEDFHALLGND